VKGAVLVTGAGGLVGAEVVRRFAPHGLVIGIDNDMRRSFFGAAASTQWQLQELTTSLGQFRLFQVDIRHPQGLTQIFKNHDIAAVVHCAAQPSHDWAAKHPALDFEVNATGTLNVLEATRKHAPKATFVHLSTNKVYGTQPNRLPFVEMETRFELPVDDRFFGGLNEGVDIDQTTHSLFGCSKLAADILVQEYGRYFGMRTVCLRGGCLTGPGHSAAELHGFLAYMMRCAVLKHPYRVIGHGGKQVRDNIHVRDLVDLIAHIIAAPPEPGMVLNVGGGRGNSVSVLEALALCEWATGAPMLVRFESEPRQGDHIWYITDNGRAQRIYPDWAPRASLTQILLETRDALRIRFSEQLRIDEQNRRAVVGPHEAVPA
jgi:CDP-paratose 2-epimerase